MAGFRLSSLHTKELSMLDKIQHNIRHLGFLGMKWDESLIKNSKAVGITEANMEDNFSLYNMQQVYNGTDYGQKEFIAFFDKEYPNRREFLRKFSMNGEIEYVIETIADECIIYDENNYFGYPNTKNLKNILKEDKAKEIIDYLNESYKKVYYAFGFNKGHDAWSYLIKFLVDGFLAFEIIYDVDSQGNATEILGFKELDPISLEPEIRFDENGREYRIWIQYRGDTSKERILLDSNLIYISWARGNFISRLSYVERLVRVFNMLRTMENTRIIWNVQNSQKRIKMVVPIGTQSEAKARTRLNELRAYYKEDVTIDNDSGEVTMNGQPNFSFNKTFIFPSRSDGGATEISEIGVEGYDLNSTEQLKYFWNRFIIESKLPKKLFDSGLTGDENNSTWNTGEGGIPKDELKFAYFINRIRSIFQELLVKPMWIQFCLKYPQFKNDESLKSAIGISFVEENLFKLLKERQLATSGASVLSTLMSITEPMVGADGQITQVSAYDIEFLNEMYMNFTEDQLKINAKYKEERNRKLRELQKSILKLNKATGVSTGGEFGGEGGMGDMGDMNMGSDFDTTGGEFDMGSEANLGMGGEETGEEIGLGGEETPE